MARAQRLLELLQILRRHQYPVAGSALAQQLGISLRSLYRDIATLQGQGAHIEGEAGVGYILKPGFMLPPLMFTEEELEAIVLGSRWVAARADQGLRDSAANALAKIAAVIPQDMRDTLDANTLLVGPTAKRLPDVVDVSLIRQVIRLERKMTIRYGDQSGKKSARTIWPFALGYFEEVQVVVAWCELRADLRHFRVDRILSLRVEKERYPRNRQSLLKEWRAQQIKSPSKNTADKN